MEAGRSELRLTRLNGSLYDDPIRLERPLALSKRGDDFGFSDLGLAFGPGRIIGNGGVRGSSLSLTLNVTNLPIASGARLLGYRDLHGSLTGAISLGGSLGAPQGRLTLAAHELAFASPRHRRAPLLGLTVDGNWNGREMALRGRVTGLEKDTITFGGSVPLALTRAPLSISVPPLGRLALQLQGSGELGRLADLLPLGEDRLSGHFTADLSVGGTVVVPAANGRVRIAGGRYENFATGMVLTKLEADLVGDRDRFSLTSLSAGDSANGSLRAQGSVALNGAGGPSADLSATLTNFRIAARDEALATANGTISVRGPLAAPKVSARLGLDQGEVNLPASLPPSVVVLEVTRINSKTAQQPPPPAPDKTPAVPAALDISIDMPGRIFVRGHGLDSEWRGQLTITGTSAAPEIAGSLEEIRGSIDLLGKSFALTRGRIVFDGGAKLDPTLDIVAETNAADITAQVFISGLASAPKIKLASTPPLPQDEILARVLFNRGTGQITPGEGLQLAQAAAELTGGGPGVLDRLRSGLGLDWFKFGSAPAGAASSILNPRMASTSARNGTALSAGKYVAPGVSVGVTQGISPPTSKITVEIQVRPHVTVQTELGQTGGSGIGLNYNYDY
jgi:translocation and assembly module TamB